MKRTFLPVERLSALRDDLRRLQEGYRLNNSQAEILQAAFEFELPEADFAIRSFCVVATPRWARQDLAFVFGDQQCVFPMPGGLINPDDTPEGLLAQFAEEGIRAIPVEGLPPKRLAVCSGLAEYGRDNLAFIEGMGSYHSLSLFCTDQPCDVDPWREVVFMDECATCRKCITACPTQTIWADRLLVNNERCLTFINENPEPGTFPDWVHPFAHNCVHSCLACQSACPQNSPYQGNIALVVSFTEVETRMLMCGIPYEWMGKEMRKKVDQSGLKPYLAVVPRNIRALLHQRNMA